MSDQTIRDQAAGILVDAFPDAIKRPSDAYQAVDAIFALRADNTLTHERSKP